MSAQTIRFYEEICNLSLVQSPEDMALAVKAAIETFVLLKNNKLLPVKKHCNKIAVSKPAAEVPQRKGEGKYLLILKDNFDWAQILMSTHTIRLSGEISKLDYLFLYP